jgi:hypothetical protein
MLIFKMYTVITASSISCSAHYSRLGNTSQKAYVGKTSGNLRSRFREHIRYIKNKDPRSAYALHILICRHEYGNINDTMTLLKKIKKPTFLLPYEQIYIQSLHHNNDLIPEQHPNKFNGMFELLQRKQRRSQPARHSTQPVIA